MLNAEELKKYSTFEKKEIDLFYNCQFEPMFFPWLDDVKKWIEKTYNTKVVTISYEFTCKKNHEFCLYLYFNKDLNRIPLEGSNSLNLHAKTIEEKILEHLVLETDEKVECYLSHYTFQLRAKLYLLKNKASDLEKEIESYFKHLDLIYLNARDRICVFNSIEEAKKFLLSEEYNVIKKNIYDLLNQFDDYNVLALDDIRIFVDYKKNYENTPMWGRWVHDLSKEEWDKYEKSIIDS